MIRDKETTDKAYFEYAEGVEEVLCFGWIDSFMSFGLFSSQNDMLPWLTRIAGSQDPLYFSVLDKVRQQRVGMAALLNIVPAHGRVEIGSIWYSSLVQKIKVNSEVTYLFLKALFREYHYRRVEWKCDNAISPASRLPSAWDLYMRACSASTCW